MFIRTGKSDRLVGLNDRCVKSTFHSSVMAILTQQNHSSQPLLLCCKLTCTCYAESRSRNIIGAIWLCVVRYVDAEKKMVLGLITTDAPLCRKKDAATWCSLNHSASVDNQFFKTQETSALWPFLHSDMYNKIIHMKLIDWLICVLRRIGNIPAM